jgi:hypothetical protein
VVHNEYELASDLEVEPYEIEYAENCPNRSQCCGSDKDEKDIGLDSTLSFSIKGEEHRSSIHHRYRVQNRALSHALSPSKIAPEGQSRTAFSHLNYNDFVDDQIEDLEDFFPFNAEDAPVMDQRHQSVIVPSSIAAEI